MKEKAIEYITVWNGDNVWSGTQAEYDRIGMKNLPYKHSERPFQCLTIDELIIDEFNGEEITK